MYPNKNTIPVKNTTVTPVHRCAECGDIVTGPMDRRAFYFCSDECIAQFDDANGSFETDF